MTRYDEEINIRYRARLDELRKEIDQIPGITKKAARQITREWVAGQRDASKAARAAVREQEKAAQRVGDAWRDKVRGGLDSVIPGLSQVADLGRDAGVAMGPSGAAGGAAALTAGLAAVGVAAGAVGLGMLAADAYQTRSEIFELSRSTGLAAETLSGLQLATQGTRLEFSEVGDAVRDFGEVMYDLEESGGRAEETFRDLGVEVKDRTTGAFRDVDDVFVEVIDKLSQIPGEAERVAYGQQLMSDSGAQLAAVLGSTPLSEYVRLSREFGVDVGPEAAAATAKWETSLAGLRTVVQQAGNSLLDAFGFETMGTLVTSFSTGLLYMQRSIGTFTSEALADVSEFTTSWYAFLRSPTDDQARQRFRVALQDITDWSHETELAGAVAEQAAFDFLRLQRAREAAAMATSAPGSAAAEIGGLTAPEDDRTSAASVVVDEEIAKAREAAAAMRELQGIVDQLQMEQLDGEAAIVEAYDRRIEKITELGEISGEFEQARLAATLEQAALERDLAAERAAAAADEEARRAEAFRKTIDTAYAAVDMGNAISDMILQVSGANVTAQEDMNEQQKRAVKTAFAINKATAIAQAGINTALGVTNALTVQPIVPLGVAMAALVATTGGIQTALIAAQKPPSFHVGGLIGGGGSSPDEVTITARTGEGVVSAQGMAALGEDGLRSLNRGESMRDQPIVVVNQVGPATVEAGTAMALARPTPMTRRALRRGSRRPGRRRRGG